MASCIMCRAEVPANQIVRSAGRDLCPACADREARAGAPASIAAVAVDHTGRAVFFALIGAGCLLGGLYLLFNPGVDTGNPLVGEVANLQKLYLGQTLAIIGAVFLAVGLRPLR